MAKKYMILLASAILILTALSACAPAPRPDVNNNGDVTPNGTMYRDIDNDGVYEEGGWNNGWRRTNWGDADNDGMRDNGRTRPMTNNGLNNDRFDTGTSTGNGVNRAPLLNRNNGVID